MNHLNKIMGAEEASKLWGLSPSYIKDLCAKGYIECIKIGKTWVINKEQPNPKGARKMETIPVPKEDLDSLYIDSVMLIDHLEKTIKDASIFLIDKSDKKQLTYSEMKELYELLVDAIGFNDGQYFAD